MPLESVDNLLVEVDTSRLKETVSSLTVDNCTTKDEGVFTVVAKNEAGEISHTARLKVLSNLFSVSVLMLSSNEL